jgi:palmitoyl transferase
MQHAARLLRIAALAALTIGTTAAHAACDWVGWDWLSDKCDHAVKAYRSGSNNLYLSGYSYHGRGTYTDEKLDSFTEQSWGGGFGRQVLDQRDNSHEIYAMAFRDSHAKPQYMAGYGWQARWGLSENLHVGIGLTAFVFLRSDFCNYLCPVPAILPLGSIQYRRAALMASYVPKLPGEEGNGDVLFLFGKIALD